MSVRRLYLSAFLLSSGSSLLRSFRLLPSSMSASMSLSDMPPASDSLVLDRDWPGGLPDPGWWLQATPEPP